MSMSNQPGTPRDDGEMGGNFLNPFQSESVSISLPTFGVFFTLWTFIPGIFFRKRKNNSKNKQFCNVLVMQYCTLHVFLLASKIVVLIRQKNCAKYC